MYVRMCVCVCVCTYVCTHAPHRTWLEVTTVHLWENFNIWSFSKKTLNFWFESILLPGFCIDNIADNWLLLFPLKYFTTFSLAGYKYYNNGHRCSERQKQHENSIYVRAIVYWKIQTTGKCKKYLWQSLSRLFFSFKTSQENWNKKLTVKLKRWHLWILLLKCAHRLNVSDSGILMMFWIQEIESSYWI